MAAAEEPTVDQAVLDKTKKELGAIIKAPRLSDRLLKKPPFRFLHDIVTNTIKATGFATKLYTDDEMDSAKVIEKEAKVFFLQKIISSVNYTLKLQPPLAAKPIKIVSGLEAVHTNDFLQKLAAATKIPIEKSDKAIAKVLARFADKAEQALKERKESNAGAEAPPKPGEVKSQPKDDQKEQKAKEEEQEKEKEKEKEREKEKEKEKEREQEEKEKEQEKEKEAAEAKEKEKTEAAAVQQQVEKAETKAPAPIERREEKSKTVEEKKVAAAVPQGVMAEGEKAEGKGTLDTDSEEEGPSDAGPAFQGSGDATVGGGDGDGYLAKLAAAKKADEDEKLRQAKEAAEKLQQDDGGGIRLTTTRHRHGKEREVFSTEVQKLKDSLQQLVKITNPLGKTFDYVQEDVDSMGKERAMWQRQAQDAKVQAQEVEHATEESLQPLYSQIQDLEDAITDQLNKIHTTRANILKNDSIVDTLLKMVAS